MGRWLMALGCAMLLVAAAAMSADARQAHPWVCIDKPVFSSRSPMRYEASNRGGGRWRLLLMQSNTSGRHEGFDVVASHNLPPGASHVEGELGAGQYYVVAMYPGADGLWICPRYVRDRNRPSDRTLSRICYGRNGSDCSVRFKVVRAVPLPSLKPRGAVQ